MNELHDAIRVVDEKHVYVEMTKEESRRVNLPSELKTNFAGHVWFNPRTCRWRLPRYMFISCNELLHRITGKKRTTREAGCSTPFEWKCARECPDFRDHLSQEEKEDLKIKVGAFWRMKLRRVAEINRKWMPFE